MIQLGVPGFEPHPFVTRDPARWSEIYRRMHQTMFLRSEGTVITVEAPQMASPAMVEKCAEITRRFDRFYGHAAAAYFTRPDLQAEFLVNPLFERLLELERETTDGRSVTPTSRLDCVLAEDGSLRVIEINSVGVNVMHTRALLFLVRALHRAGLTDAARTIDTLSRAVVDAFDRAYRARHPDPSSRPVIGMLNASGFFRATKIMFRDMFRRAGWEYVSGGPEALEIGDDGMRVAGQRVDILWPDFLFYMAYQEARYSQTKWPSAIGEYKSTPAQVAAIFEDRRFFEHLRTRRVVMLGPAASYLALPKSLLSWIHDEERPVPAGDRAWLQQHVARTYSARDRARGVLTLERTLDDKDRLLIKPCQYGGSHGVRLGVESSADDWSQAVRTMWSDETWIVQDYWSPVRVASGAHLSVGVSNFGGQLGGIYLRTSTDSIVSARTAAFVPVTVETA